VTDEEIKAIARQAAQEAVDQTLRRLNLSDEDSGQDLHDLRELLSSWRSAKRTMWTTVVRSMTLFVLGMLALGVVMQVRKNLGE
jgi:tRNA A-37 threonylcarbamoyl transferase component Bud32